MEPLLEFDNSPHDKIKKEEIYELINYNRNVRLIFAQYMPVYGKAIHQRDWENQKKCMQSICESILLFFPKSLQKNPQSRIYIKDLTTQVINEQYKETPEYISAELCSLIGRLNSLIEEINNFLQYIECDVIYQNLRFDENTQKYLYLFKQEVYSNINKYIKIVENMKTNAQFNLFFNENKIRNDILQYGKKIKKTRIAKIILPKEKQITKLDKDSNISDNFNSQQQDPSFINLSRNCFSPKPFTNPILHNYKKLSLSPVLRIKQHADHINFLEPFQNQTECNQVTNEIQMGNQNNEYLQNMPDGLHCDDISFKEENNHSSDDIPEDPFYPFQNEIPEIKDQINYAFDITQIMDSGTFVFHILSTGLTPTQAIHFLNHLGIKCYSFSVVYEAQNAISPVIIGFAKESTDYRYSIMPNFIRVTFDGAWAHVRNAYQHTAVLIESLTHKIIASQILSKDYRSHPGNYENDKAGNLMEICALKLMKDVLQDPRITTFTSDGDVKIRNVIKKLDRKEPLILSRDPGHAFLSISRTLRSLNTKNKNIFTPLIINFEKFVKKVVFKIEDSDLRVKIYKNISAHYAGIHNYELCMHDDQSECSQFFNDSNPNALKIFEKFLDDTSKLVGDIHIDCSTQINESFNRHSKKYINKLYAFRATYKVRTAIAILDWNEPYFIFEVLKRINSTQAPYTIFLNSVKHEIEEKKKSREMRSTEKWKQQHKSERMKKKGSQYHRDQKHINHRQ